MWDYNLNTIQVLILMMSSLVLGLIIGWSTRGRRW